jgi:hypothetical protein
VSNKIPRLSQTLNSWMPCPVFGQNGDPKFISPQSFSYFFENSLHQLVSLWQQLYVVSAPDFQNLATSEHHCFGGISNQVVVLQWRFLSERLSGLQIVPTTPADSLVMQIYDFCWNILVGIQLSPCPLLNLFINTFPTCLDLRCHSGSYPMGGKS